MSSVALGMPSAPTFSERIWRINWGLVLVLSAIAGIGVLALYSAAGGRYDPWAVRHAIRYGAALGLLLIVALVHPKVWLALAWPIYIAAMAGEPFDFDGRRYRGFAGDTIASVG